MIRHDSQISSLLEQFTCVRVVQMNGLDVSRYQFDGDQTWAAFFLHSDGTILGRYGTRHGGKQEAEERVGVESLQAAMERALALHEALDDRRAEVEGKQGEPLPWKRVEDMPAMTELAASDAGTQQCIHCHHTPAMLVRSLWREGRSTPDRWLWPFPPPESVGLTMSRQDGVVVDTVREGSPAATAGVETGDRLETAGGQALLSAADLEWVLHNSPRETTIPLTLRRGEDAVSVVLELSGAWRETDLSWRESAWQLRPGLWLVDLSAEERTALGLAEDELGLRVKWVLPRGAAKGVFQDGDVLIEVAGQREHRTESELIVWLLNQFEFGAVVQAKVIRGTESMELSWSLR